MFKGHSFVGYFLLSHLFFPLALIMAYVVNDRTLVTYNEEVVQPEVRAETRRVAQPFG